MHFLEKGGFVEIDGLLGVVVGVLGDPGVPEDHIAVWLGTPQCRRISEGGSGGTAPEVWAIPIEHCAKAQPATTKH
jgi:hypothetical protein